MQLPQIITHPNPILRKKAKEILPNDIASKDIENLIRTLKSMLAESEDGIGIAAPQIGRSVRLFLVSEEAEALDKQKIETDEKQKKPVWKYRVFINPVITKFSVKKTDMAEGCLSVPGVFGLVKRPEKITVEWLDERGKKHSRGCSKFFARVIQHETDHIDGILFIDKMHTELELDGASENRL